jgi:general secretion pathway protein C
MLKNYIIILNILLIGCLGYVGFSLVYHFTADEKSGTQTAEVHTINKNTPPKEDTFQRSHYNSIAQRNLFTIENKTAAAEKKINIENLKETKLDLKLWGTVAGDSVKAYAVIEDLKSRKQNLYRPGDTIEDATIKMIIREKVVLTVDGKDEILQMQKVQKGGTTRRASGPVGRQPPRPPGRTQTITLSRSLIEESIKDLDKLSKEIKMQPHMENGEFDGLILTGIRPRSLFRRLGLRNGDIITSANGDRIDSAASAMNLLETFMASSNTSLEIKRRGRLRSIKYNFKE